jgi:serine/threonine protein kinase
VENEIEDSGLPAFGRYQTFRVLGEGAMASVYLAKDPHLSRRVAIKVIKAHLLESDAVLKRFGAEAGILANLRHPNILQVYDYDVQDGEHFLVMEYIEGPGFQSLLSGLGDRLLPPQIAAYFVHQAALGLSAAHKQGLVHRDVKPDNMLLASDGTLKISDFGIAHVADLGLTQAGDILGTPYYMAPEQTLAETPLPQTDLWALGVVLYYCLTGRRPFEGADFSEIKRRIRLGVFRPVSELAGPVDPELVSLVDVLLAMDPAQRGTASSAASHLKRYLDKTGIEDWDAHIREFLAGVGLHSLEKTTVEFRAATPTPGHLKSTGRKNASTHRSNREDEEPAPEPVAAVPGKWDHYKRMAYAWALPLVLMVGIQFYTRWNIAHPPTPPQQKAILQIKSSPPGAKISVDGDELGMTPLTQPFNPGQYHIKVSHFSFPGQDKDTMVYLGPGMEKIAFRFHH